MLEDRNRAHSRNIILTAAAFWVAGALTGHALEAPLVTAQSGGAIVPDLDKRIQGNLHGMLGLKFEEHILAKVKDQVRVTLGTFPKVTPEAVAKTADDAVQRLDTFMTGWRFGQAPTRTWKDNNSKATVSFGVSETNIDEVVLPAVTKRVKSVLRGAITTEMNKRLNATVDPALIEVIARIATGGATTGFGEWVCIFNPETGRTEWYNQTTGVFAGPS